MIKVSEHAIEKHFERFGGNRTADKRQVKINSMRKVVAFGRRLEPKSKMMKLLNNSCVKAQYYNLGGVVVVLANDTIVTAYKYVADKWL